MDVLEQDLEIIKKEYLNVETFEPEEFGFLYFSFIYNISFSKVKYIFMFYMNNHPYEFLKINSDHLIPAETIKMFYIQQYKLKFFDFNFPEISKRTNNFIFPLLIEIQN